MAHGSWQGRSTHGQSLARRVVGRSVRKIRTDLGYHLNLVHLAPGRVHRHVQSRGRYAGNFWTSRRARNRPRQPGSEPRSGNCSRSSSTCERPTLAKTRRGPHDHRPALANEHFRSRCPELTAPAMYSARYCATGVTEWRLAPMYSG